MAEWLCIPSGKPLNVGSSPTVGAVFSAMKAEYVVVVEQASDTVARQGIECFPVSQVIMMPLEIIPYLTEEVTYTTPLYYILL